MTGRDGEGRRERATTPRSSGPASARSRRPWLLVATLVVVAGAVALARRPDGPGAVPGGGGRAGAGPATGSRGAAMGPGDACRRSPSFVPGLGLGGQPALATSLTNVKGLAILHGDPSSPRVYQHETWDDAGYLGPFITDVRGHVYVAPVPLVSLEDNPPELQNRVYRVDSASQAMELLIDLPRPEAPPGGNPFGVVGLGYDCGTDSLYVTSVAGSTARTEEGRIYQVDLRTRRVAAERAGVDAVGVSVFTGASGRRLYYAPARRPEVWSIALDDDGAFVGAPRRELDLAGLVSGGRDTVRRIRFGPGTMTLALMDFTYSLQVAGEREEDMLGFSYDPAGGDWTPVDATPAR